MIETDYSRYKRLRKKLRQEKDNIPAKWTKEDIEKYNGEGKSFLLPENYVSTILYGATSIFFLLFGLLMGIIFGGLFFFLGAFGILAGVISVFALYYLLKGRVIIISPEGLVFRKGLFIFRFYRWEEMEMRDYEYTYQFSTKHRFYSGRSASVNYILPKGKLFNLDLFEIRKKTFTNQNLSETERIKLFMDICHTYFEIGHPYPKEEEGLSKLHELPKTTLQDLKKVRSKYKNGYYTEIFIDSNTQLEEAINVGKIFYIKGRLIKWVWVLIACLWVLALIMLFLILLAPEIGFLYLIYFAVFVGLTVPFLLQLTNFIIIGPNGIFFRKSGKTKFYEWKEISNISFSAEGLNFNKVIHCFSNNRKPPKFEEMYFRSTEFPKKENWEYVITLFQMFFQKARNQN